MLFRRDVKPVGIWVHVFPLVPIRCSRVQRVAPPQAREAGVVAVGRDPLAARFDRDSREERVGHDVPLRVHPAAEVGEDPPVSFARGDLDGVGLPAQSLDELKRLLEEEARPKRAGIPDDQVSDFAVSALAVMRGLARSDKLRVLRRMQRMLGSQAGRRRNKQEM